MVSPGIPMRCNLERVYQRTHRIWKAIAIINDAHLLFPLFPQWLARGIIKKKFEPVWRNAFSLKWWPPVSPVPPISVAPEIDSKCDNLAAARMLFSDQLRETLSWKSPSNTRSYTVDVVFLHVCVRLKETVSWDGVGLVPRVTPRQVFKSFRCSSSFRTMFKYFLRSHVDTMRLNCVVSRYWVNFSTLPVGQKNLRDLFSS